MQRKSARGISDKCIISRLSIFVLNKNRATRDTNRSFSRRLNERFVSLVALFLLQCFAKGFEVFRGCLRWNGAARGEQEMVAPGLL